MAGWSWLGKPNRFSPYGNYDISIIEVTCAVEFLQILLWVGSDGQIIIWRRWKRICSSKNILISEVNNNKKIL
jgi:hypothetical protein